MKRMTHWRIAVLLTLLVWAAPTWAHTVILRNGQVIYGEVVQQDRQNIYVAVKGGKKSFTKSMVLKILFQEVKEDATLKRIIRVEIAKQQPANEEEDIKIVDFNEYVKEVVKEEKIRQQDDLRRSALWRSALLPGWGQWYAGQTTRGGIYGGMFLTSLAARLSFYQQNMQAQKDYKNITLPALSFMMLPRGTDLLVRYNYYKPIKDRLAYTDQNAKRTSALLVFLWTAAMIDAAFFTHAPDSGAAARPRWEFIATPSSVAGDRLSTESQMGLQLSLLY